MVRATGIATAPPLEKVHVPAWALLVVIAALFSAYLVLQENGWLLSSWETLHELFHDGRHAIGVPCH
jgi:cobalt transporter subunit CbtB